MTTILQTDKPAAVIMETVQAEGGIRVFDVEFLKAVREFCTKNDILMIVDDIQIGCCRSGSFFSFERAGIQPDIVVMSKSIGGIGMPMSIVLHKPEIDVWKPGEHNGTFRGNQLSFVAGKAAIEYLLENNVEAETKRKGDIVKNFVERKFFRLTINLSLEVSDLCGVLTAQRLILLLHLNFLTFALQRILFAR